MLNDNRYPTTLLSMASSARTMESTDYKEEHEHRRERSSGTGQRPSKVLTFVLV